MMKFAVALIAVTMPLFGCARVIVTKNPGPEDQGIRYYRPKPYLFIGPAGASPSGEPAKGGDSTGGKGEQKKENKDEEGDGAKGKSGAIPVTIRLEYLPDYNEEYSIRVTPGVGQAALNVSLQNGWNLNSVDAKTDQRYAEIIGSLASLVGATTNKHDIVPSNILAHRNVPLGYYEGVLAMNECGGKELIGWRYVGFLPGINCPVKGIVCRGEITCNENQLYALVFSEGTLCFLPVNEAGLNTSSTGTNEPFRIPRPTYTPPLNPVPPSIETRVDEKEPESK